MENSGIVATGERILTGARNTANVCLSSANRGAIVHLGQVTAARVHHRRRSLFSIGVFSASAGGRLAIGAGAAGRVCSPLISQKSSSPEHLFRSFTASGSLCAANCRRQGPQHGQLHLAVAQDRLISTLRRVNSAKTVIFSVLDSACGPNCLASLFLTTNCFFLAPLSVCFIVPAL